MCIYKIHSVSTDVYNHFWYKLYTISRYIHLKMFIYEQQQQNNVSMNVCMMKNSYMAKVWGTEYNKEELLLPKGWMVALSFAWMVLERATK